MITVYLNDEAKKIVQGSTLAAAISSWQIEMKQFAIAVNKTFVARTQYAELILTENDRIHLVTPMCGG